MKPITLQDVVDAGISVPFVAIEAPPDICAACQKEIEMFSPLAICIVSDDLYFEHTHFCGDCSIRVAARGKA